MKLVHHLLLAALLAGASLLPYTLQAQAGTTTRVSVSSGGVEGNDVSSGGQISADGRFVAFGSDATNLVVGDTNGVRDVFVHDRVGATTERLSISSAGVEADQLSQALAINADGRYVAFGSNATNLVPGDTNGCSDVFVRDRVAGTTERVSVSSAGAQAMGHSHGPAISSDGRFVAFYSHAANLVPGDTNGVGDVFVHDRQTGTTERVSVSSAGVQGNDWSHVPAISGDGLVVVFPSAATNLIAGDTNGMNDVFVHNRVTGVTERVSVSTAGQQGNDDSWLASVDSDGRFVAFRSHATNLVGGDTNGVEDVFVRDRLNGTTERVSVSSTGQQASGGSFSASISADGRYVLFFSSATDLVAGDTNAKYDVFLRDRLMSTTQRTSVSSTGQQANGHSNTEHLSGISADGRYVAFDSSASNLVSGDTNSDSDVFVHEPAALVSGTITFQYLDAGATPPAAVLMRIELNGQPFGTKVVLVAPDGSYTVGVPWGLLGLSIKHAHWLRRTVSADTSGGSATGVDFLLINGDATDDNSVDLFDLNQVLTLFGTADSMTDLDEEGLVLLPDLNIVLLNFGNTGDP
jgi:hypothetical protein